MKIYNLFICKVCLLLLTAFASILGSEVFAQAGFPFAYGDQVIYYPKLHSKHKDLAIVKEGITQSLKRVGKIYDPRSAKSIDAKDIQNILVTDDRIEVQVRRTKNNYVWLFSAIDDSTMFYFGKHNAGNYIFLPSLANFAFAELDAAQQFADNIYALQYPNINRVRDSLLNVFQQKIPPGKAASFNLSLNPKMESLLSLADSAVQNNDYFNAIQIYLKAIEVEEFGYAGVYANVALLYAQINFFDYAIMFMKKYLMIETDAAALRGARDKIYEWEALIYY